MPKRANGPMRKAEVAETARTLRYNWDDVIFFLEVARARNLVRAGQKLKVDHTTVSRRVRELERGLNTTLFKRSKAGFALTEAGRRLLQYAEGMENNANAIIETVVGSEKADAAGAVRGAVAEAHRRDGAVGLEGVRDRLAEALEEARPRAVHGAAQALGELALDAEGLEAVGTGEGAEEGVGGGHL